MRTRSVKPSGHGKRKQQAGQQRHRFSSGAASAVRRLHPETLDLIETIYLTKELNSGVRPTPSKTPSPAEIEAGRSAAGGWTRATLARWGVSWPPPRGWKKRLERDYYRKLSAADVHLSGQMENLHAGDLPGNQGGGVWCFLLPLNPGKRAHIWVGDDTLCRMASTGTVDQQNYLLSDESRGVQICHMCKGLSDRHVRQFVAT